MTLKNNDGTVYKLVGPNPLSEKQHIWGDSDCTVENMEWPSIILPDERKFNSNLQVDEDEIVEDDLVELKEPVPPKVKEEASPKPKLKNVVDIWCLPAVRKENVDDFYGSKEIIVEYLDKIMFEGIIVENNGLSMTFWTNIDTPKKGSIIFISRNSEGHGFNEKRWWKVEKVVDSYEEERLKDSGGYLFYCLPSEYTPYFE